MWLVVVLMLASSASRAASITVGVGEQAATLSDAVRQARDGDTILVPSGEYRGDVAVLHQRRLTIRGVGRRPVLIADGRHAEGKAILVVRDGEVTIENLEFRGARVPDGNGAGIRFEKGKLTVRGCAFFDNENGLLTANFDSAELTIEDSEFAQAPRVEGKLHHLLYVGRIASLQVSGSRFHAGHVGHLLKSRARRTTLTYNLLLDGAGGRASYEVDLPNGGEALLLGNVIGQSAHTENRVVVAYGAEGNAWPQSRLRLAHNTLISEGIGPAWFLRVWKDRLPRRLSNSGREQPHCRSWRLHAGRQWRVRRQFPDDASDAGRCRQPGLRAEEGLAAAWQGSQSTAGLWHRSESQG